MKRLIVIVTFAVLLVAMLLTLSGPAVAYDLSINAVNPSSLRTGPMVPGSTWTFTYVLGGDQSLIGAGVPATVYIFEQRTQRVADTFATTLLPGTGVLSLTPQWTCSLKVGSYAWTLWPTTLPTDRFVSISQTFKVVKRL